MLYFFKNKILDLIIIVDNVYINGEFNKIILYVMCLICMYINIYMYYMCFSFNVFFLLKYNFFVY